MRLMLQENVYDSCTNHSTLAARMSLLFFIPPCLCINVYVSSLSLSFSLSLSLSVSLSLSLLSSSLIVRVNLQSPSNPRAILVQASKLRARQQVTRFQSTTRAALDAFGLSLCSRRGNELRSLCNRSRPPTAACLRTPALRAVPPTVSKGPEFT